MSKVGIIVNPASGKDIRRLVSRASVFDNLEKVHILRRILLALDALHVEQVIYMADYEGLVDAALRGLHLAFKKASLPLTMWFDERDTTEAGRILNEKGVNCIVTLGGDGTNRAVAKSCKAIPIIALSTGTNNVFPSMIEGTLAGMAAGLVARKMVDVRKVSYMAKRLDLFVDGRMQEIALIDAVACTELFVGSRALWDPRRIREIVLARAEPASIGISSVGGLLQPLGPKDDWGLYLRLGEGNISVLAPVGPGLIKKVCVKEYRLIALGEEVELEPAACTIAVDGERQMEVFSEQRVTVRLARDGPCVVDVRACLQEAGCTGILQNWDAGSRR